MPEETCADRVEARRRNRSVNDEAFIIFFGVVGYSIIVTKLTIRLKAIYD